MENLLKTLRAYRPIHFHQVCALARVVIVREPTISDSDWKAAIKDLAAKQGYGEPPTEMLGLALTQVENAVRSTIGPRPIAGTAQSAPRSAMQPIGRTEAKAILSRLNAVVRAMPDAPVETPEDLSAKRRVNDKRIAARMVAAEIVASIERCEELERAVPVATDVEEPA